MDLRRSTYSHSGNPGLSLIVVPLIGGVADLRGADLEGVHFAGADLRDADLRGASLLATRFHEGEASAPQRPAQVRGMRYGDATLLEDARAFLAGAASSEGELS